MSEVISGHHESGEPHSPVPHPSAPESPPAAPPDAVPGIATGETNVERADHPDPPPARPKLPPDAPPNAHSRVGNLWVDDKGQPIDGEGNVIVGRKGEPR